MAGNFFKRGSAEILSDILSEESYRRGVRYLQGENFKADRERVRREAAKRLKDVRDRYAANARNAKKRTPEAAATEKQLTLRLAEVEAEAAELRLRLSELLGEEEEIRTALDEL